MSSLDTKGVSKILLIIGILFLLIIIGGIIASVGFYKAVQEVTSAPEAEMTVLRAEIRDIDTYGLVPREGKYFLYLQVRLVNNGDKEISINPLFFELETDALIKYNYHDHQDALVNVLKGGTHTFWLSFEIPEGQKGTKLYFKEVLREPISATVPTY